MPQHDRYTPENIHRNRFQGQVPHIPQPKAKEEPVREQLTQPMEQHDNRPVMRKVDAQHFKVPNFNKTYGSLRVENGWRYAVDNYAVGTITSVAATAVNAAATLVLAPNWRLEQWPGGTQLYIVLRSFSIAPQTATFATAGNLDCRYIDLIGGNVVPLGVFLNTTGGSDTMSVLIPTPITDPGVTNIGQVQVTLNTGATVGTYNWQVAFSVAYMVPALQPYHESVQIPDRYEGKYAKEPASPVQANRPRRH